jgi:hypothetical protein
MSRITGNDAKCLMEAYSAVYTPQELTEEQVWEEVETWVNSLLEEGYDLSDYTWEEMYESYIEEVWTSTLDRRRNQNKLCVGQWHLWVPTMQTKKQNLVKRQIDLK